MKKTFACPKCNTYKTIEGRPGEKKILICDNCKFKGKGIIPIKKIKGYKLTKKQKIILPVSIIFLFLLLFFIVIPSVNGDLHFLTVQSGSMEPNISVGDVVVSSKVKTEDIKIGDVITFRYSGDDDPNKCYTHRVSKIIKTQDGNIMFQTKGDANEDVDKNLVRSYNVIGKSIAVLPYMGYVGEFARSKAGYFIFLVIPFILIIGFETKRIFKIKKEEKSNSF